MANKIISSEYTNKKMYYANFNITFGNDSEPMLEHFFDIIYPAMTSGYIRESPNKTGMDFVLTDVKVKEFDDDMVLVGNYVKNMGYSVNTTMENGELEEKDMYVPSSPYSRFIIFLQNHRMVLIKNESVSPDVRSFQAHFRKMINNYIHISNLERKKEDNLPAANINIVDMPFDEEIRNTLKHAKKIEWINFKFFPLNADISPLQFANDVDQKIKELEANSANLKINSPRSIETIIKNVQDTSGLAVTSLRLKNSDGSVVRIKEGQFKSDTDIFFDGNINSKDDKYLISQAKKNEKITKTSSENLTLFEKAVDRLRKIIKV